MAQLILSEVPIDELNRMIEAATVKAIRAFFPEEKNNDLLKSISEISETFGISRTTAQKLKNNYPHLFHLVGLRKFVVSKAELLSAIKTNN